MADVEFRLPRLGMTMQEATVEEWLVREGQTIREGEDIVVISTDKVENAMSSPASGVVTRITAPVGATVAVGTLLAVIAS